ncbi:MAG: HigA family addiction module antitoxin [Acetobacteraceae bacterium]
MIRREDLDSLDLSDLATDEELAPVTPGDVLRAEFMEPRSLSARALARALSVPANRITGIVHGDRAVTAGTAILLGEFFGTTPEFWMNLQSAADLEAARRARRPRREPAPAAG